MTDSAADFETPAWLAGQGLGPQLKWHCGTDGRLTSLTCARETGDIFFSDEAGTLARVDRRGQITALTRLHQPVFSLQWSDDGSQGAVIAGDDQVLRLNRDLQVTHKLSLPDVCMAVAVSPFGHQLAISLAGGDNMIYNERNRRIARFETMRPLSFLRFCVTEQLLFGAAEHGMLCCHNLNGAEVWREKNWSNVGKMTISGDGEYVYLASFAHGVQALDGDGASIGSYVLEGTINRVDASFEPHRLVVATVERDLYWLDADGELLWGTRTPDDIVDVLCDPLGEWAVCGLSEQGIYRLDWGGV